MKKPYSTLYSQGEWNKINQRDSLVREIDAKIVEGQEQVIMSTIRIIGGATYEEITVDKHKVFDALKRCYSPVKPVYIPMKSLQQLSPYDYACPACDNRLTFVKHPHCPNCGQILDWEGAK